VVRPAAIEASLRAANDDAQAREGVVEVLRLELQAARYTADRAFRQFDSADPENRLVVDELERRWNEALEHVQEIDDRIRATEPLPQSESIDPDEFHALGEPSTWIPSEPLRKPP
jgi:hypothetical protein